MTKPPKEYDVGYRKPPKKSQFKKGRSGNPNGRPKGASGQDSDDLLQKILNTIIDVPDQEPMSVHEGLYKAIFKGALSGKSAMMKIALEEIKASRNKSVTETGVKITEDDIKLISEALQYEKKIKGDK